MRGNLLFVGGDDRMLHCAKTMSTEGYEISLFGFEKYPKLDHEFLLFHNLKIALLLADVVVLPTPVLKEGHVFAPYSDDEIEIHAVMKYLSSEQIVFGSKFSAEMKDDFLKRNIRNFDFLNEDSISIQNAYLTAQATLLKLLQVSDVSLHSKKALILGFGRIAKSLTKLLGAFDTSITIAARKSSDLELARLLGCEGIEIGSFNSFDRYDYVINTVPEKILKSQTLENCQIPFFELACFEKIDNSLYFPLPGLPGKCFPKSAGEILASFMSKKITEVSQ